MKSVKIILIETSHPGNIGSAARAMKNMGFKKLVLVNPKTLPNEESYALAAGATDILDSAEIVDSLNKAIGDCALVLGCSARQRSLSWPMLALPEASKLIAKEVNQKQVGILFGSERSGLSNEDLQHCHYHLYIPSNAEYSSLNLAQAVQVVTYALLTASSEDYQLDENTTEPLATMDEFEHFFGNFKQLIELSHFAENEPNKKMLARLRRLFQRAEMRKTEIDILQGILRKTLSKLK